ncbi:MAG TPA: cbb3-type cytochrome c oxidase subunit I [Jiangellaceae bacterium]
MAVDTSTTPKRSVEALAGLGPLLRAALWGLAGFAVGALVTAVLQGERQFTELALVVGYVTGLAGWQLGIGGWETVVRPLYGGSSEWDEGTGRWRYFRFNTDHKVIGLQYLVTAGVTFGLAGLLAMVMRTELATAELDLLPTAEAYNNLMSIHGTLMLFAVSVVAIVGGFGNYFVPLMIGAEDMAFPRLNATSYWLIPPGVLAIIASPLVGGFQGGWTSYQPLGADNAAGQLLFYLGVYTLGLASLLTAINVIATTVFMRAPGLTWGRLPIFVWTMLLTSVLNLVWVPEIGVAMVMGIMERVAGTTFFAADGGLPLLWQDLFWMFGHPEVYIIMLTAWGLWLEILAVMGRKTLFGYRWVVGGFLAITLMSSIVWAHHMFATSADARLIPFMSTTELISIPTGLVYLSAIGTLWLSRVRLTTPMLLVLFSMLTFLLGGVSGVFLADAPADFYETDTYFVVAHFHYVIVGGMIFAWLAGLYYWFPKYTGKMFNEAFGKVAAWLLFIGFNATFFPMHFLGLDGMNRRIATYLDYMEPVNIAISILAAFLGLALILHLINLVYSWATGPPAGPNPWGGKTLEWETSSPPPRENFEIEPLVLADFYSYGDAAPEPGMVPIPGVRPRPLEPEPQRTSLEAAGIGAGSAPGNPGPQRHHPDDEAGDHT